jgi:putative ABC transport system ATP-binding protein
MPAPHSPNEVLLQLREVRRTFTMGEISVEVLKGVTLEIFRGEFLAIVGPSGSGKTTILNLIGGLDWPTEGTISYKGRDLTRATPREMTLFRRDEVGFVFQFYNLVPNLTARENLLIATEISRQPLDVDESLRMIGLTERAGHFPSQLSGGEQQRIAIARAVVKNPELLLCDEPTGALDFQTGKKVLRILVDLNKNLGKTVVVITHNASLAQVADRVIHLRSGEISELHVNDQPIAPEEVVW